VRSEGHALVATYDAAMNGKNERKNDDQKKKRRQHLRRTTNEQRSSSRSNCSGSRSVPPVSTRMR